MNVAPDLPIAAQETVGTGPVMIAMLLPRSAAGPAAGRARDFFDGARLAVDDLGGGQIRLVVYDTASQTATPRFMAEQAIAAGAKLIVGPTDAAGLAQVAAIPPRGRPPVIGLAEQGGGQGVFAFSSDFVDSAIEGARAAISAGQSQVLALVPEGFGDADRERFARGVARNRGRLVGTISYPQADAAIGPALKAQQPLFAKANTVVIFGTGRAPSAVARAIVAQGLGSSISTLVGNSGWPNELHADPVLDGVLIALADQESLKEISSRYGASAGRPLSLEAALAYDAVAIAAGLVRLRGPDALKADALISDAGFRGSTGLFRLRKDGSVERRHTVYRIERGKLAVLQGQGDGF